MKINRKKALGTLFVFIVGGLSEMVVACSYCFEDPYFLSIIFISRFFYSGLVWVSMWRGSEFLVDWLDIKMPWLNGIVQRFVVSVLSIIVYVFVVIWAIDIFLDILIFKMSLTEALKETGAPILNVIQVTLLINIFMHGRGFLLSWRQTSIDMEKLKTEQVFTQFQSLKNQVNPHFLFNSLNALSSLVYEDQDKAVNFIRKLSQVYRYVLDKKDDELVKVDDELDFMENFIFLQQIRFGENLKVSIEKSNSTDGYLPPLALQLLVENAIKHNVISEKDPLSISIRIENSFCVISNSIKEKLHKDSTGIGLANLEARYEYLSKEKMEIGNDGIDFVVKLPVLQLDK
ncbi:MAG: sensor histidine kinase [Ekhidna sp.]